MRLFDHRASTRGTAPLSSTPRPDGPTTNEDRRRQLRRAGITEDHRARGRAAARAATARWVAGGAAPFGSLRVAVRPSPAGARQWRWPVHESAASTLYLPALRAVANVRGQHPECPPTSDVAVSYTPDMAVSHEP